MDGEVGMEKVWIFKFLAMEALKYQSYGFHLNLLVLSLYLHISKFDSKPIATLSKTSFKPSYLEPNKPPKLP